jgi:uncharacterized protein (DUF1800 family)
MALPVRLEPEPASPAQAGGARWRARRVLDRLAFGPAPGEEERVADFGPEAWIRAELARPAPPLPSGPPYDALPPGRGDGSPEARRRRREEARGVCRALLEQRIERAVAGTHPIFESMVDFWGNHFHVFARKGGPEPFLLPSWERDVLRGHALGDFTALLQATAAHPAMLFYLDNWRSASRDTGSVLPFGGRRRRRPDGINENYARELLELHTLGVDGGYTQRDVVEVARAFTGWTLGRGSAGPAFRFAEGWHDEGPKTVLDLHLPARGGEEDGRHVLAMLAAHPATARHLARKLARRFLADDPPEAAVARTARRFLASGGDLRGTLETLLLGGPELFDPSLRKLKTPFELVVSSLRAVAARLGDGGGALRTVASLGGLPYLAPSPAGYPDVADRWLDPDAALGRLRFAFALSAERMPGLEGERPVDPEQLVGDAPSAGTRRALATPGLSTRERLALALASPEFQTR